MRITGVEAAIAHYREAGTKKDAHNRNCAQMGSAQLGVLLYPDQESVDFDKILRSECKIRKENHFVEKKLSILYGIFSINELFFFRRNFGQKYEVVNIS